MVKEGSAAGSSRPPGPPSSPSSSSSTAASSRRSSRSARPAGRSATPTRSAADDARSRPPYQEALDVAAGKIPAPAGTSASTTRRRRRAGRRARPRRIRPASAIADDHRAPRRPAVGRRSADRDAEADLRAPAAGVEIDLDAPLYTADDAEAAVKHFDAIGYGEEREVAPGIHATFLDAGHILGSAIIRLRVEAAGRTAGPERETTIVFSGDLGRPGHADHPRPDDPDAPPTTSSSSRPTAAASTSPRTRRPGSWPRPSGWSSDAGGVLLIPSFAIGRTQEIVYALDRLLEAGTIPQLPLYLDSPMASKASDIYRRHADYFDEETRRLLESGDTPLDYPNQTETRDVRRLADDRAGPAAVHDRRLERDADRRPGRSAICGT